ncbi:MAG: hypothetical protein ACJAZW_001961 [Maritalea sp.]
MALSFTLVITSAEIIKEFCDNMRDKISSALKIAIKARDPRRTGTYRLINAAIKDRDIEARGKGKEPVSEQEILQILQKMVKQREESATVYAENGREELAIQEREEIAVIQEFLPQPLSQDEVEAAIGEAIAETGAEGLRDMGKVVGVLKEKYPGRIDFGQASRFVKTALNG